MSIATVVTRGYGSFGSIPNVVRRGYSGSTIIGRRRRTKFYHTPLDIPQSVKKKAEKHDVQWLIEHYESLIENASTEARLLAIEVQLVQIESQYQITALKSQAVKAEVKLQSLEDEEDLLLLT